MNGKLYFFFLAFFAAFTLSAQIEITDADLVADGTYNWTADNVYVLDGLVYLEEGGTLNIEAGTVVKFKAAADVTTGDNTSALIISRGAQIFAEGTADAPIIFTAEDDDLNDPDDFTAQDRGEWGGLIILGSATVARPSGIDNIEGITAEDRTEYGGGSTPDDGDNSGVLKYVSIRHGGAALAPGDEINGLTLGGVGAGTEIDFIEVFANLDDGIEWFGGTVNVKHAAVSFAGDDAFDVDFGFRGKGQFWFSLQGPETSTGRAGEHDGANPDNQPPFSQPTVYNATYIGLGNGATAPGGDGDDFGILARDNFGGFYNNSIFTGFPAVGLAVEDRNTESSFERLQAGDLAFTNNTWFDFGAGNTAADLFIAVDQDELQVASSSTVASTLGAANNTFNDPQIAGVSRTPNGGLDPRLNAGSPDLGGNPPADDGFFQQVTYRGAFGNNDNWLASWTALAEYGYLGDLVTPEDDFDCITITDADLVGGETYNWTANNCYTLDGLVYLEAGGRLNIEPGTIIRGAAANNISTGDNTSALIITQGAQIFADGAADAPIVFTAEDDDLNEPDDFTAQDRGEWGGLIILGTATIARPGGTDNIEGITAEPRTAFGGGANPNDEDNSGRLKYVSIRHAGAALAPGDEINGLTLGGVGSGTEIDFIEVFANLDDGIEWFGGTVDVKHAAVSFCGDDSYDYDFGYRGKGQFWFSLQSGEVSTGRAGEHDGANPDNQPPFSQPEIYNATYIGLGVGQPNSGGDADDFAILMRDNAGGFYNNSIFTDFPGYGLGIEDRDTESAFERLQAGDLAFNNSTWFGFGEADFLQAIDTDENPVPASSTIVQNIILAAGNTTNDPSLAGISRVPNNGLDPRLNAGSDDLGGNPASSDAFFQQVTYRGAFGNRDLWLEGWTALDNMGYLGDLVTPEDDFDCITITDADLVAGGNYNWTANNCYTLDGLVYLEEGGQLSIEPGTVIRGAAANNITTGDNTSALIITKGAQIFANGTATDPVIFTAEDDDLNDPEDFLAQDRGEWGGLIILGNATIARPGGTDNIEGITAEPRTEFGGGANPNDEDNSGRLNYVSIRHAGAALAPGDEINGLTLGGVGSGTEIDFIEVFANLDDGIEWFGGTVDVKHAAVSFCGDDSYDYDFGYRGKGQFWFSLQSGEVSTGRAGEHDGANPDNQPPFSQPEIYNATYIGLGVGEPNSGGDADDFAILMRDNAGGFYNNSIFTDFPGYALGIEDRDTESAFERLQAGDLAFTDNTWFGFGEADFLQAIDTDENPVPASSAIVQSTILAAGNTTNDPSIASISRVADGMLDPRLNAGSPDLNGNTPGEDQFFQQVTYRGAFGNSDLWLNGWTALSDMGYLGDLVTEIDQFDCVSISDDDLQGGLTYNWGQNGECYFLDGLVYLEDGGVLNIAPGTVIRGLGANEITTGDNTSALIISQGAQIFADGTSAEPVIFTASQDDLSDPTDFSIDDRGEWGGLIILGRATVARPGGTDNIEGITAEPRTQFGGGDNPDDEDNSGRLNYVSIRHGGAALAPGDEINGLTLGGVGSGTEMDYIEVIANLDDGIEWFGGTVDMKHAAVTACGDDAYDYDFGWRGRGQFWFSYQEDGTRTGRAGEHDGANPDNQPPFSQPTIFNATYVGIGESGSAVGGDGDDFAILMRDNAGGFYNNSIFTDFPGIGLALEDRDTDSAFERLQAGDLAFNNNFWFGFGAGTTAADLFVAVDPDEVTVAGSSATVASTLETAGNAIQDPVLNNMDRSGPIDPRPQLSGSPASGGAPAPTDNFFETVSYFGAFAPGNGSDNPHWLMGWTATNEYGIVDLTTGVNTQFSNGFALDAPVPNPANQQAMISFELPATAVVDMTIVDALGRPVMSVMANQRLSEGVQNAFINTAALPQGMYIVVLEAEGTRLLQKLVVNR